MAIRGAMQKRDAGMASAATWSFNAPRPRVEGLRAGRGSSLPDEPLDFVQPRIGHDFSKVRVHAGAKATVRRTPATEAGEAAPGSEAAEESSPEASAAVCAGAKITVSPLEVQDESDVGGDDNAPIATPRDNEGSEGAEDPEPLQNKTKSKGKSAAAAACPVPTGFSVFTDNPGGDGSGRAAATATGLNGFNNGAFVVTFDAQSSWVDTDIVTKAKKRAGNTTKQIAACNANFKRGNTSYTLPGQTACAAAPSKTRKVANTGECESVIGAGLDADGIADEPRLLTHEQYHVKLVCAAARKAAATLPAGTKKVTPGVKAVYDALGKALQPNSDQYDADTAHGCKAAEQTRWQKDIDAGNVKIAP